MFLHCGSEGVAVVVVETPPYICSYMRSRLDGRHQDGQYIGAGLPQKINIHSRARTSPHSLSYPLKRFQAPVERQTTETTNRRSDKPYMRRTLEYNKR